MLPTLAALRAQAPRLRAVQAPPPITHAPIEPDPFRLPREESLVWVGLGACIFLGLLATVVLIAFGISGCGAPAPVIEADVADVVRSKARLGKDIIAGPLATVHPDPVADGGCPR